VTGHLPEALHALRDRERALAAELRAVGDRHANEHDVLHMCRRLARRSDERAAALGDVAGVRGPAPHDGPLASIAGIGRRVQARVSGRTAAAGPALLDDLCVLSLLVHEVDLHWVIVGQGARAARDRDLVDLAVEAQTGVEQVARWIRSRIQEMAAQVVLG
jgi:hypothetical protein